MQYEEFCTIVKSKGAKYLLKETTEYDGLGQLKQLYAEVDSALIGCYSSKTGGVVFGKPLKLWSKSRRKFDKVKI